MCIFFIRINYKNILIYWFWSSVFEKFIFMIFWQMKTIETRMFKIVEFSSWNCLFYWRTEKRILKIIEYLNFSIIRFLYGIKLVNFMTLFIYQYLISYFKIKYPKFESSR